MKAVGYYTPGPIERDDALLDLEIARPRATGRDILVRVEAVSVNPLDTKLRASKPAEGDAPVVLGYDAVGEVVEIGADVTRFKVGDKVWSASQGSNAEYLLVDERIAGQAPASIDSAAAAALPLTTITAQEMLFDRLRVTDPVPGSANAVLIIGASGGVGSIAIQLLRAQTDLTVIATASRPQTRDWVMDLGAHHVVDHSKPLPEQIAALGIGAPGYVFSTHQSDHYIPQVVDLIAPQGRFGLIDSPEVVDVLPLKGKAVSIHWEMMFVRSLFATPDMGRIGEMLDTAATLVDAGKIRSTVTENFGPITAANLKRAHVFVESNKARGKIVLSGF